MQDPSSVASPGGWATMFNARISSWLVVGALAVSGGGGAVAIYGQFQGAQAALYCEGRLVSATVNTVTYSCLNPLPNDVSGAILYGYHNYVFEAENTSPVTTLSLCTSTGASQPCRKTVGSSNVMSGVYLNGAKRVLSLVNTGSQITLTSTPVILAPRNYATSARKYLNATFTTGSGQTATGKAPATIRMEIVPCNLSGVGC